MDCITGIAYSVLPRGLAVHAHDEHELIFITAGSAALKTSSGEFAVRAPALISIGHLEKHAVSASGTYERYVLTLRPDRLPPECERLRMFFVPQLQVLDVGQIVSPMTLFFELLLAEAGAGAEPENGAVWLLQSLLLLLYRSFPECFPSCSGNTAQTVRRVQALLEQNLDETISLKDLSRQFHISVYHLSHSFKAVTGCGVLQYRLKAKIAVACELLATTDGSISQIGEKAGFPDASSFARCFKKSLGCTPRQYRRQTAERENR